jgi:hypothetical protein
MGARGYVRPLRAKEVPGFVIDFQNRGPIITTLDLLSARLLTVEDASIVSGTGKTAAVAQICAR